jgi:TP901 family phage tail tape measure protein
MFRRAGADLRALQTGVNAANAQQAIVQARILQNATKTATVRTALTSGTAKYNAALAATQLQYSQNAKNLEDQRAQIESNRVGLMQKENTLSSSLYTATSRRLKLEQDLTQRGYGARAGNVPALQSLAARGSTANKILANDLLANYSTIEKIQIAQAEMPAEWAKIDSQVSQVNLNEEQMNLKMKTQVEQLNLQNDALGRQKVLLGELLAEGNELQTTEMAQAKALDAQAVAAARVQRAMTLARTAMSVGRAMQFGGLIATAALGATAYSAAKFSQQVTLAATQMANISEKGFSDVTNKAKILQNEILTLMHQFPATAAEQAQAAYNIFSGVPATQGPNGIQKGFAILQIANKAAVAGMTDLGTATGGIIRLMNDFGNRGQSVNEMLNRMFAIIRFGHVHLDQFTTMLNQIGPAALGAKQSLNSLAGIIAMGTLGVGPSFTATGLARMLQIFQRPTFIAGLQKVGIQPVTKSGALKPLLDVMDQIVAKFPQLEKGGVAVTNFVKSMTALGGSGTGSAGTQGTIQFQRLFNVLITNMPLVHKLQNQIISDNKELDRSYAAMSKTSGVRWSVFMNLIKSSVIQMGFTVIPVFQRVGSVIRNVITWFDSLSPHTRKMIGEIAAAGAITALLGGTLLITVGGFVQLGIAMMGMLKALKDVVKWMFALDAEDILILAGFVVLIGGMVMIATHWKQLTQELSLWWKAAWDFIKAEANAAVYSILQSVSLLAKGFGWLAGEIGLGGLKSSLDKGAAWIDSFNTKAKADFAKGSKEASAAFKMSNKDFVQGLKDLSPTALAKAAFDSLKGHPQVTAVMRQQAALLAHHTGIPYAQALKDVEAASVKKGATGSLLDILSNPKAFDNYVKGLTNSKNAQAQLNALINQTSSDLTKQANLAASQAGAVVTAEQAMANKINTIVQKMETVFNNFQQANETMFGELFQGRIMQGPLGDVYQQLAQFNIAPPFSMLLKDLKSQDQDFETYRKDLKTLARKGAPQTLINELMATGPSGRLAVKSLAGATQAQIAAYIAAWKEKRGDIQNATTVDFSSQLQQWKSYGQQTAWAILTGLKSQSTWLKKGFTQYILSDTLEASFKAWIYKTFPNVIAQAGAVAAAKWKQKESAKEAAKAGVLGKGVGTGTTVHKTNVVHQTVHATKTESLSTTLRRAKFEYEAGLKHHLGG